MKNSHIEQKTSNEKMADNVNIIADEMSNNGFGFTAAGLDIVAHRIRKLAGIGYEDKGEDRPEGWYWCEFINYEFGGLVLEPVLYRNREGYRGWCNNGKLYCDDAFAEISTRSEPICPCTPPNPDFLETEKEKV